MLIQYFSMGSCVSSKDEPIVPLQIPRNPPQESRLPSHCEQPSLLPLQSYEMAESMPMRQDFLPSKKMKQKQLQVEIADVRGLTKRIMEEFSIIRQIGYMLGQFCCTENGLIDISNIIIDTLIAILNGENIVDKKAISKLFSAELKKDIKEGKLFYRDLIDLWAKQDVQNIQHHKQANLSRIFHTLANYVRDPKQKSVYDQLSAQKLDEIVQLEHIEKQIENLGEMFYFSYLEIKQESQEITELLRNCFQEHGNYLMELKYEIEIDESLKVAQISREACEYHEDGIFILLVYFIRSCHNLESKGTSVEDIEAKLLKIIQKISELYPPGQGLDEDLDLQNQLRRIEMKSTFKAPLIKIFQNTSKQEQLQKIIIDHAKMAQQNRGDFETLIRQACLQKSIAFKSGLKYNPDNPNEKSMTRIQQKMFFKSKEVHRKKQANIASVLRNEELIYKSSIQKALSEITEITFNISDMIRAKCTFSSLEDIIETVQNIKRFVDESNRASPEKYEIIQIQSRFTRSPPISDITLKIVLNKQIISQLQLTLQSNLAAYYFAHKIYEFNRSLIFSKVKIIHNYFQQYRYEFDQLVMSNLQLANSQPSKYNSIVGKQLTIKKYFGLSDDKAHGFEEVLNNCMKQRWEALREIGKSKKLKRYQPLMKLAFERKMEREERGMGERIKKFLESSTDYSTAFRSVIILQILKQIDMTKNFEKLKLQYYSFFKYAIDELGLPLEGYKNQLQVSARIFIKIKEHDELYRIGYGNPYLFDYHQQSIQKIYGKQSLETAQSLINQGKMYERKQNYEKASKYYSDSIQIIYKLPVHYIGHSDSLAAGIKLLIAQLSLKQNKTQKAKQYLSEVQGIFKAKQENDKIVICQMLLAQCALKENKIQQFDRRYQQLISTCKLHGVSLKGEYFAEAYWRIGIKFRQIAKKEKDDDKMVKALDVYLRKALEEFGGYMGWNNLLKKIRQSWKQFESSKISFPKLSENKNVRELRFKGNKFSQEACLYLSQVQWPNLTTLVLENCEINEEGCANIVKGNWPSLTHLNLSENRIGREGCISLCKAVWPLNQVKLWNNKIENPKDMRDMLKQRFPKADVYL